MLDKLRKQVVAVETATGQEILEMMRDFSEKQAANPNISAEVIKGFQIMINHVKSVRVRYEDIRANTR